MDTAESDLKIAQFDLREAIRGGKGVRAIRLQKGDEVAAAFIVDERPL